MTEPTTDDTQPALFDVPDPVPDEATPPAAGTAGPEGEYDGLTRQDVKYRARLREAEAERDALVARLSALQRAEAERLAAAHLGSGEDLWAGGTDLASLLAPDGNLNPDAVADAAQAILTTHPHWAPRPSPVAPASLVTGNHKPGADEAVSFVDAFRPG